MKYIFILLSFLFLTLSTSCSHCNYEHVVLYDGKLNIKLEALLPVDSIIERTKSDTIEVLKDSLGIVFYIKKEMTANRFNEEFANDFLQKYLDENPLLEIYSTIERKEIADDNWNGGSAIIMHSENSEKIISAAYWKGNNFIFISLVETTDTYTLKECEAIFKMIISSIVISEIP